MSLATMSKLMGRLARLQSGTHPVVSCYLKLEPRDRSAGKYKIKLKNRVRAVESGLDRLSFAKKEQDQIRGDLARIQDFLGSVGNLPASRGIALFASTGHRLFEAVELPKVFRSRLGVDRSPLVSELASIDDQFGVLLTVVMDRSTAQIWQVTAFAAKLVDTIAGTETRGKRFHSDRRDAPGRGEHNYQSRIRHEKERLFAAVADRLFNWHRTTPVRGIVVAAPGAAAGALEPFLHPYLVALMAGTVKLSPKDATPAAVLHASLEARAAQETQEERGLVEQLSEQRGTGWAVNGVGPTLKALAAGKVRTLLIRNDTTMPGFRCQTTGRLTVIERDCRLEGGAVPVLDVIDDAIEDALRQRVGVDVVYDPSAAEQISGLAALLRFR